MPVTFIEAAQRPAICSRAQNTFRMWWVLCRAVVICAELGEWREANPRHGHEWRVL